MRRFIRRYDRRVALPVLLAMSLCALLFTGACGSDDDDSEKASAAPFGTKPLSKTAWKELIAKAKTEGKLTVYTSWFPDSTRSMNAEFKKEYGISVIVNRANDDVITQQLHADKGVGKVPDVFLGSSKPVFLDILKSGWAVDAVGPNFFNKRYDRETYMLGKAWDWATSALGLVWNTETVPQGLNSPPDLLKPEFKGKFGVIDPRGGQTVMDMYLWLDENFGKDFTKKLAAQEPKVYSDGFAVSQSVASGEINAGFPGLPPTTFAIKAEGGPVDFNTKPGTFFNSPYWGVILEGAPHPAAAQLYANYMLNPEAQGILNKWEGAVYPDIPDTFFAPPRELDLKNFTPEKVDEYLNNWDAMFR